MDDAEEMMKHDLYKFTKSYYELCNVTILVCRVLLVLPLKAELSPLEVIEY